jgi:hypothetical protein
MIIVVFFKAMIILLCFLPSYSMIILVYIYM